MSVGGDRLILDTIGKQIQFSKEKEFIYKLLVGQAMNNSSKSDVNKSMILNQLKEKSDSHQSKFTHVLIYLIDVMSLLIEKVLSDDETRERLLD